jgi:predicted MPP superfamily phosphohydrolase
MLAAMLIVRHKTRRAKFMVGIPLIIAAQVAILAFAFDENLSVGRYSAETDKIDGRVTLALVTDLHSCDYGDGQRELLDVIDAERPDAILLCGDIFDTSCRRTTRLRSSKPLRPITPAIMFPVLLSHRPERIEELLPLEPDLVLSGHAHGGQWRIPLLLENGLMSPNQNLFPKYTNGEFFFGSTEMIVSRGLARETTRLPRIFNRPEIVIVTLESVR